MLRLPPSSKFGSLEQTNLLKLNIYQNTYTGQQLDLRDFPIMGEFVDYLPPKPYCTDQLGGLLIRPKETALKCVYMQYNPIHRAYWLVFDIDTPEPRYWYDEWKLPAPNIEVRNPVNDHQHLFYLIDPAVYTLRQARRKPLELAADVDRGLTELLGADPGYGKLIAKNPLHEQWLTIIWHEQAWGLTELLDYIPRRIQQQKAKPQEMIGLGRNCTVFERSRVYAYREWRRLKFDDYERLFQSVYAYAMNLNEEFIVPMLEAEVKGIVRSVSKWTAKHMSAAGFSHIQKERNLKSQVVRKTKAEERAEKIRSFKAEHPGMSNRMIAEVLNIPETTLRRLLNKE